MNLYKNKLFTDDVIRVASMDLPWEKLGNKSILISGATGLLGSFLIDVLMTKNKEGLDCRINAIGRSREKMELRFSKWWSDDHFSFIECDVNKSVLENAIDSKSMDFVIHLASNTHPMQYATDPIGTITTNITGLQKMLDVAVTYSAERFVFASSNEIYGENRGDTDLFEESYCGYINSNTLRAGYPESKRCGEALCQAYKAQKGLDIVIPRFTRSYGPTMLLSDTKAISQFLKRGVEGKDIILKSEGTQNYSYTYVADAVSGLLFVLLLGESGEAYNIADEESNITLKELATIVAEHAGKKVVFELPDAVESSGYSRATKALLDGRKIKRLGWKAQYSIYEGIPRTMDILNAV